MGLKHGKLTNQEHVSSSPVWVQINSYYTVPDFVSHREEANVNTQYKH
jgi:hypothetical protein